MRRRPSPILLGLLLLALVVTGMSLAPASGIAMAGAADTLTLLGPALALRMEEGAGLGASPPIAPGFFRKGSGGEGWGRGA